MVELSAGEAAGEWRSGPKGDLCALLLPEAGDQDPSPAQE